MRGDGKRKKAWFQQGHEAYRSETRELTDANFIPFQRLTYPEVATVLHQPFQGNTSLDEHLQEANPTGPRLLRPKQDPELKVEKNAERDCYSRYNSILFVSTFNKQPQKKVIS